MQKWSLPAIYINYMNQWPKSSVYTLNGGRINIVARFN